MTKKSGSAAAGPSKIFTRMLEGKVTSKQYADTVKRGTRISQATKPSS